MTTPHKATPEQWAQIKQFVEDCVYDACILELRDRITALEAASNRRAILDSSPAPAGGLVERVAQVITDDQADTHLWHKDARAAILAVAEWLENERGEASMLAASWLREEVKRHA